MSVYSDPEKHGVNLLCEVIIEGPTITSVLAVWDDGDMLAIGQDHTCTLCGGYDKFCHYFPVFEDFSLPLGDLDWTADPSFAHTALLTFSKTASPGHIIYGLESALRVVDEWRPGAWTHLLGADRG